MTTIILARVRAWLTDTFTYEFPQQAADAMADATRWGWLPALSGVAVGAEQARTSHSETLPEAPECLVQHTIA